MRILLLTEDERGPSTRYRVLQFLPYLEDRGIDFEVAPVPRERAARRGLFERCADFDRVVLQRRLVHPFDFRILRKRARFLVFDFDDAILFPDSGSRRRRSFTRWVRFLYVATVADLVVAGNAYLAELAARFSKRVNLIPTTIDLSRYAAGPSKHRGDGGPTAVWIGSSSTLGYLEEILPAFREATRAVPGLRLRVIADAAPDASGVVVEHLPFRQETEVEDLAGGDIGIAPLPDDRWARGKCGLKLLQYLATGLATIASPVGVQSGIVADGESGLLASSPRDWSGRLIELARDPGLRSRLGTGGRARVEEGFGLEQWGRKWVEVMTGLEGEES